MAAESRTLIALLSEHRVQASACNAPPSTRPPPPPPLQLGAHPIFKRVSGGLKDSAVYGKGRDMAEGIRERWETSDSPLVHRIQVRPALAHPRKSGTGGRPSCLSLTCARSNSAPAPAPAPACYHQDAKDSLFAEGEPAQALREIRARDPTFDMVAFLQHLRHDVPVIIKVRWRRWCWGRAGVVAWGPAERSSGGGSSAAAAPRAPVLLLYRRHPATTTAGVPAGRGGRDPGALLPRDD